MVRYKSRMLSYCGMEISDVILRYKSQILPAYCWDTNSMIEERLTNQTSPQSRFMFSFVILMWSKWELFTLVWEVGALEPSISANYTIISSLVQIIQQAVKAVPCYIDAFYCQASQLYAADLEKWNFRWQARLCIVNTRDSRCPDSQGRHKKWSAFA
jgi:hypothetical protein